MTFVVSRVEPLILVTAAIFVAGCVDKRAEEEWATDTAVPTRASDSASAKRSVPIQGTFGDGWEQMITLPGTRASSGERVRLWVNDGLLYARRELSSGELDWQFILCHVQSHTLPEIFVKDGLNFFELAYRDGRFFIRETRDFLRCLREPGVTTGLFAKHDTLSADSQSRGYGSCQPIQVTLSGWQDAEWFFAASGTSSEDWTAVVRLNPVELSKGGYGFQGGAVGMASMTHGNTWVNDDGELLVASRTLAPSFRRMRERQEKRDAILAGGALPDIDASAWLNSDGAKNWDMLKGKVVLVDFWGTWCGPCVAKLPETQSLHEKFADRGLVALGIHSDQSSDECEAFLEEHDYTFPVAVDSGKTAEAFAIDGWPTYFLIDRSGKLVSGFEHSPPSEEQIELLLGSPAEG